MEGRPWSWFLPEKAGGEPWSTTSKGKRSRDRREATFAGRKRERENRLKGQKHPPRGDMINLTAFCLGRRPRACVYLENAFMETILDERPRMMYKYTCSRQAALTLPAEPWVRSA